MAGSSFFLNFTFLTCSFVLILGRFASAQYLGKRDPKAWFAHINIKPNTYQTSQGNTGGSSHGSSSGISHGSSSGISHGSSSGGSHGSSQGSPYMSSQGSSHNIKRFYPPFFPFQFPYNFFSSHGSTGNQQSSTLSCDNITEIRRGYQVAGGTLQMNITTVGDCRNFCISSGTTVCAGIDWDNGNCWIHTATTECGTRTALSTSTHYSFIDCLSSTTDTGTAMSSVTISTTTTTQASEPAPVASQVVKSVEDYFIDGPTVGSIAGGIMIGISVTTDRACMELCVKYPKCLAIDYNFQTGFCYAHVNAGAGSTACDVIIANANVRHYKRIICDGTMSVYTQTLSGSLISGTKTLLLEGTLEKCLSSGALDVTGCNTISYDCTQKRCYKSSDCVTSFEPRSDYITFFKDTCEDLDITELAVTVSNVNAPSNAVQVVPPGWALSIGHRGDQGLRTFQKVYESGDACLNACESAGDDCVAMDYDTSTTQCFFYDDTVNLNDICPHEPSATVCHAYKLGVMCVGTPPNVINLATI